MPIGLPPPIDNVPFIIVPVKVQVPVATFVHDAALKVPEKTSPPPRELVTENVPPGLKVATLPMLPAPVAASSPDERAAVVKLTPPRHKPHGRVRDVLGTPSPASPLIANKPEPDKLRVVRTAFEVKVPPLLLNCTSSANIGSDKVPSTTINAKPLTKFISHLLSASIEPSICLPVYTELSLPASSRCRQSGIRPHEPF